VVPPRRPLVLVVDDDEVLCTVLEYNLSKEGFEVRLAHTGAQALELLEQFTPDLLLIDWMLPAVSGVEVCRRARAEPRLSRLPILMVSALDGQADRDCGLRMGADEYVSKPFALAPLIDRAHALLAGTRAGRSFRSDDN